MYKQGRILSYRLCESKETYPILTFNYIHLSYQVGEVTERKTGRYRDREIQIQGKETERKIGDTPIPKMT